MNLRNKRRVENKTVWKILRMKIESKISWFKDESAYRYIATFVLVKPFSAWIAFLSIYLEYVLFASIRSIMNLCITEFNSGHSQFVL